MTQSIADVKATLDELELVSAFSLLNVPKLEKNSQMANKLMTYVKQNFGVSNREMFF